MFGFDLSTVLGVGLALLGGWNVVSWLFKKDTEIEKRRLAAGEMAATLQSMGLKRIPKFLLKYSVGDYSGMAHDIRGVVELFASGEGAVVDEFKQVFERVLTVKLRDEEGRAFIAAKLAEAARENRGGDPEAAAISPTPVPPSAA